MENYTALSDEQLVFLSQQGDGKALSLLTEKYMNVSKYIASDFSLKNADESDLTQEGMIGFLSAVYSYKKGTNTSFHRFCSCCIKNRILSLIRATNSRKRIPEELIVSLEEQPDSTSMQLTPEENLISEKSAAHISSVISEALSKNEKEVFMLYLAGFSYEEISIKTELSQKAVDSALQRSRRKLRKELQNEV